MRGLVPGMPTAKPLLSLLPAPLQDDWLAVQIVAGLDSVLAPIAATLDCVDSYVSPEVAPLDFLDWLAGWVGAIVDETWPETLRRTSIQHAVALYRARGTIEGLRAHLELATGAEIEITDSGGVRWSTTHLATEEGRPDPEVVVRVSGLSTGLDRESVNQLIAATKPAHVAHRLIVDG